MKKKFFLFFIYFNFANIPEIIKNFLQKEEKEKEEEKKINTITQSSIKDRIKKIIQEINYPFLNENDFLTTEHIKKINKIIFKISDSDKKEKILMEIHSLRRAIYLEKIKQKKEQMLLSLKDINDIFLAHNIIPQLESLIHNYLFSFLLDQESLIDAFLELKNKQKDEIQKNFEKIQFIFKDNTFLPLLMDLICTQINACGSHMFLQKENNTIKIHDLFEQSVDSNIEFFTTEITEKYKNLYKTKNYIFAKGSSFEGDRQTYFNEIYSSIIKKLNIESKYPILYDPKTLTEQELFKEVFKNIICNFAEQYVEQAPFNKSLLETLILIDNPKKHQYYDINYFDKLSKTIQSDSNSTPFFYNNAAKGNSCLEPTEFKKNIDQQNIKQKNIKQKNKKKKPQFSKTDYCLAGGTMLLIAYNLYIQKN